MLVRVQADPIETLVTFEVFEWPANTAKAGSPFSTGITSLGNGGWEIDVGGITGDWKMFGKNADDDVICFGYGSTDHLSSDGAIDMSDSIPGNTGAGDASEASVQEVLTELATVIKSGEQQAYTRAGQPTITFTATKVP